MASKCRSRLYQYAYGFTGVFPQVLGLTFMVEYQKSGAGSWTVIRHGLLQSPKHYISRAWWLHIFGTLRHLTDTFLLLSALRNTFICNGSGTLVVPTSSCCFVTPLLFLLFYVFTYGLLVYGNRG